LPIYKSAGEKAWFAGEIAMFDHLSQGRWWDRGLDLVTGCTPVSPGCAHCWSAEKTHRAGYQHNPKIKARYSGLTDATGRFTGTVRPQWQDLDKIGRARKPQVYTFWNDLFHPGVEEEFITSVMLRILTHPQHFYIICTKRPERALKYFQTCYPNLILLNGGDHQSILARRLMIMTSTENQEMADLRLPFLLQIPGVLHGVSVEPGLGLVDLEKIQWPNKHKVDVLNGGYWDDRFGFVNHSDFPATLDWVICGGETGPHGRPMHPDIPRKLLDDCQLAGVPFFFKSWGEWQEGSDFRSKALCVYNDGRTVEFLKEAILAEENRSGIHHQQVHPTLMTRTGKRAAGRLLDGRTWDEVPTL
jgi:protein gp37